MDAGRRVPNEAHGVQILYKIGVLLTRGIENVAYESNKYVLNGPPPGGSVGEESACNAGDLGSVPGSGRSPGEGNGYPLQYSCLESPHGQRSLVGYSPWGRKESDTTERLSTAQHPQP